MHDASLDRGANRLGAVALAIADGILTGITGTSGVSASASAALVVLSDSPGLSVTELGRRIGLSQPAAARMVDSIEAAGLAERRRGAAGRQVHVTLTSGGREAARSVLGARGGPLTEVLSCLDEAERATLEGLLSKLLARLYQDVGNAALLCRLCDRNSCVKDAVCPVGRAERERRDGE